MIEKLTSSLRTRLFRAGRAERVEVAEKSDVLLSYEGDQFIECCYLSFLDRRPDSDGLSVYLAMLSQGSTKVDIAYHIAKSGEAHDRGSSGGPLAREVLKLKLSELIASSKLDPALRDVFELAKEQLHFDAVALAPTAGGASSITLKHRPPTVAVRRSASLPLVAADPAGAADVWLDLTSSMQWDGRDNYALRAELEIARGLKAINPKLRYCVQIEAGFAEIASEQLGWLFSATNIVDAYMSFFGRNRDPSVQGRSISVEIPATSDFFHPFKAKDFIVSAGWVNNRREALFAKLKALLPEVYLAYSVTAAPTPETAHLRSEGDRRQLSHYLEWISRTCDFVIYSTETVKRDTEALQVAYGWPWVPGTVIKLGGDIVKPEGSGSDDEILDRLGVSRPFILSVGEIEPRGNQDTIYRAYRMALKAGIEGEPQLVLSGRPAYRSENIVDVMDRDPQVARRLVRLAATDLELDVLYRNCQFTLVPNLSDSWSLALSDSLGYGKLSIAADTPSLREGGGDLVEYVAPFDVRSWADQILYYSRDRDARQQREKRIAAEWAPFTWLDTNWTIDAVLADFASKYPAQPPASAGGIAPLQSSPQSGSI